jgi:hypothetical protein
MKTAVELLCVRDVSPRKLIPSLDHPSVVFPPASCLLYRSLSLGLTFKLLKQLASHTKVEFEKSAAN